MRQNYGAGIALMMALFTAGVAGAQDDNFIRLKSYDGQNRAALAAIQGQVHEAAGDTAKLATIESGLVTVLEDSSATFAGKQEACRVLWGIGTARSVPALAKMLTDNKDDKLADAARYALERNPDPAAARALIVALPATTGRAQIGVINSLGDRAEPGAVKSLAPLTMSGDATTADAATIALGKIGTPDALKALRNIPKQTETVLRATLHCADRLAATGKRGDAEKVYLALAQSAPSAEIAEGGLRGLAALGSKDAGPTALAAVKKSGDPLQLGAASVLAALPDEAATREAITVYPSLPAPAQVILLSGWAARGVKGAIPHAETAISASDPTLRTTGLKALAQLEGAKSVPTLAKATTSGTDDDKRTARQLLATMPGKEATDAIFAAVSPEKVALISVIAERGTDRDRAFLTGATGSGNDALASEAVKALGHVGKPEDYERIVQVLTTTKSDRVRDAAQGAAVESAQRFGDREKAAAPLIKGQAGASVAARVRILGALAQIGGDASLAALTQALNDSDADIRAAALTGLSENWTDARPAPALINIAKTDSNKATRVQALRGYIRLIGVDEGLSAESKVVRLSEAMKIAERPEEKKQVLGVARDCRIPSAVTVVSSALTDAALFDEAADAVLYLAGPQKKGDVNIPAVKGPETSAALEQVIKLSKDPEVRQKAEKLK